MFLERVPDSDTWHTTHDGDPYFVYVHVADRSWKVTRQVDLSSVFRTHTVTKSRKGKFLCDCDGFRRGGKCRHVQMVESIPS